MLLLLDVWVVVKIVSPSIFTRFNCVLAAYLGEIETVTKQPGDTILGVIDRVLLVDVLFIALAISPR